MANPDPEITPPDAKAARPDAIVATGRSDYPNQVNNVLGFPFIFRGALDVRATTINEEMKIAAAHALAELARQQVPEEVAAAYGGKAHSFGADYIIPAPFDPRLMEIVPAAVAQAAMDSGVAPQADRGHGRLSHSSCASRLNPTTSVLTLAYEAARANPQAGAVRRGRGGCRAARRDRLPRRRLRHSGAGRPRRRLRPAARARRRAIPQSFEVHQQPQLRRACRRWSTILYERLQRRGYLHRELERMVNQDRNIFAALLLALGEADVMITGVTRPYAQTLPPDPPRARSQGRA